ncbi:hypothetical protein HDG37_002954 [Paraburkholderia sp. MM5384-R2]|nr:hypothetical protein [Paraburkholderia sp. MM5384-R2]
MLIHSLIVSNPTNHLHSGESPGHLKHQSATPVFSPSVLDTYRAFDSNAGFARN